MFLVFFFKQNTAYEMRISDWSSDVCSSDLEPTTTDANLVLGRLGAEYFLGGEMGLDVEGARKAVSEKIAKPLGLDTLAAAAGIVEVANSLMTRALDRKSVV